MSAALRKPMTLEEFLAWEERRELRYEFDGFRPVAMTGGTIAHDEITANVREVLRSRLAGSHCRPLGPNVKILVAGRARYPDALVTCSPQHMRDTVVQNPVVVFEVISGDTARTDRIEKLREYQATQSIQRYIILEQASIGVAVFARQDENWIATALTEGDTVAMPEIGVDIALKDFYAGLEFPSELPAESER